MPYIDKDAVNRVFVDELGKIPSVFIAERIEWDAAREAIIRCARGVSTIPTADVVEVVRCKECKHYLHSTEKCALIDTRLHFYETDKTWTDDAFCSWGERREDG